MNAINGMKGKHHSEESNKKRSISLMGHAVLEETVNKILESRKWYKHSEETKKKMRKPKRKKKIYNDKII